ncbi:MAG: LuxR C-terminal-related transcriptional regulator [Burkholderiaceae bacterium]
MMVDLELPDGNGLELLAELSRVPRHQDRHHAVFRRRAPVSGSAVRCRRLPVEGRPLRGAGRRAAEDRARPATVVSGDRPPSADALPARWQRRQPGRIERRRRPCRALAVARRSSVRRQVDQEHLTPRENEVLTYLSKGFTIKEIANLAGIKWFTVNDHIRSIYKKLNVTSRAEAAVLASKQALA